MTSSTDPTTGTVEPMARLTIGAFARAVGLTPSALRFYDDAGLLAPAVVDQHNGYRYYEDHQRRRAILVRQMRELDVPLVTMRAVLDGNPDEAGRLLAEHVDRLADRADRARDAMAELLRALRAPDKTTTAPIEFTVGGPELTGAIRQVGPFAATDDPTLDCLLLDVADGELTVVGTDRYRLGARTLPIADLAGPERRLPVAAVELAALAPWLRRQHRVRVSVPARPQDSGQPTMIISGLGSETPDQDPDDLVRRLRVGVDRFPDYRRVLASSTGPSLRHRLITDRVRLLELIAADQTSTVLLDPEPDAVIISRLNDPETHRLPAVCSGAAHRLAFAPELLASALQSSVGPDVLIDSTPGHAAVIRSADEGSFSTLVMPRRLDGDPAPNATDRD